MSLSRQSRAVEMIVNVDRKHCPPLMKVYVFNEDWNSDVLIYVPISCTGDWPQFPNVGGVKQQILSDWFYLKGVPIENLHIFYAQRKSKDCVEIDGDECVNEHAVNEKMYCYLKVDWIISGLRSCDMATHDDDGKWVDYSSARGEHSQQYYSTTSPTYTDEQEKAFKEYHTAVMKEHFVKGWEAAKAAASQGSGTGKDEKHEASRSSGGSGTEWEVTGAPATIA